jgi:hypothetical protein
MCVYSAAYIAEEAEGGQDIPQQLMYTHSWMLYTEIANKMQQCIKIYYSMFI